MAPATGSAPRSAWSSSPAAAICSSGRTAAVRCVPSNTHSPARHGSSGTTARPPHGRRPFAKSTSSPRRSATGPACRRRSPTPGRTSVASPSSRGAPRSAARSPPVCARRWRACGAHPSGTPTCIPEGSMRRLIAHSSSARRSSSDVVVGKMIWRLRGRCAAGRSTSGWCSAASSRPRSTSARRCSVGSDQASGRETDHCPSSGCRLGPSTRRRRAPPRAWSRSARSASPAARTPTRSGRRRPRSRCRRTSGGSRWTASAVSARPARASSDGCATSATRPRCGRSGDRPESSRVAHDRAAAGGPPRAPASRPTGPGA